MTFAQAAERHLDDVYGYLAWFTGDRTAAEDLAAETFERALRLWHRFDPERGSARTWLCQVARTVALDHFRSERRRTRLTAGEREVVALRVVLDLDAVTAARALGISATNCTTRLNRALRKLEEALHVAA